jgi:penicillin-binding protein 1C
MVERIRRYLARGRPRARVRSALLVLAVLPVVLLLGTAAFTPLPPELTRPDAYDTSTEILDRHGVVLREIRSNDGTRARWRSLDEVGPIVPRAVIAAEDRRFDLHPGIDPAAIARAAGQVVVNGRVVSGASTITQQLGRTLVKRPRSLHGKFLEMALAIRIEASLEKRAILEQYINRVTFGPGLRGIEAASRFYFDKPARDLSLAEAAALAGMPRGPSLYDPRRGTERILKRRARVLDRMVASGFIREEEASLAKEEPIVLAPKGSGLGAPHLVRGVLSGAIDPIAGELRGKASSITLTIDRGLQREVEVLAQRTVGDLASRSVTAASVVVIENRTGEILAYVGSPDIEDAARLGHNDGVLALRQPGSTLKPFVYGLALERLGFTAGTALPDVALHFPSASPSGDGDYHPQNYDGRFHGPVRLREALANSYNVPAVWTAAALGPDRVLERLREVGLTSLTKEAASYGVAIALGDGEVRLLALAGAYATLARGGVLLPVRAVREARGLEGSPLALRSGAVEPRRVLDEAAAYVITDILADRRARLASFGENSALELPFPVAAKTGTSKGFRDNFTVGYTPEVTVAVWVGNFDGSPMEGVSGVTGAGPLFREVMLAASRLYPPTAFVRPEGRIEEAEVCPLSGDRPGPACPHTRREIFVFFVFGEKGAAVGAAEDGRRAGPARQCAMHEHVRIERRSGLRAGPGCPDSEVEERVFERYDADLRAWAEAAGRPVAPEAYSPRCPGARGDAIAASMGRSGRDRLRIAYPPDGAAFAIDPSVSGPQAIRIRADVPAGATGVAITLNGRRIALRAAPYAVDFPLTPGTHRARVEADGIAPSEDVAFTVD